MLKPRIGAARRVLFVGHDASRTGAPIILLHLLHWLREHTAIDFDLLLREGGDLVEDYRALCTVFLMPDSRFALLRSARDRVRSLFGGPQVLSQGALLDMVAQRHIGLVYSNTITNNAVLARLGGFSGPVVCHAHEVETLFLAMESSVKRDVLRYIAGSEEIFADLVRCGIAPEKITLVPEFVTIERPAGRDPERRKSFREQHRIPEHAILVGGCGTVQWQKGPDLLVHVANALVRRPSSRLLHFAWLGGKESDVGLIQLKWDVSRSNLSERFSVIASMADTTPYFDSLDIFALTSRNDPLPLVALEAGACGLPVVCFAGNAKPVKNHSGVVVPYLDLDCFAQAIRELAEDDSRRTRLGGRLAATIRECHDVSIGAPTIAGIIESLLSTVTNPEVTYKSRSAEPLF